MLCHLKNQGSGTPMQKKDFPASRKRIECSSGVITSK